ncbi:MAG: ABC transporter ATP-binding protein [Candidatus Coatesbacteria bacterium]|nr:ABC transporter ATP-binding protein [Candidatus Coatesbacteria bacterium]
MQLLDLRKLTMKFGGLVAINELDLSLENGDLLGLIGPNGAGKTTVFNVITGVYSPTSGFILLENTDISGTKPYKITSKGIARTFQNIRLFKKLTVLDNIKLSFHTHIQYGIISSVMRGRKFKDEEKDIENKSLELLEIFELKDYYKHEASALPYGLQRRLEIARAMATSPKILLLDEPAAGMNPVETQKLQSLIHFIKEKYNLSILLIEHHIKFVMDLCNRIIVLDFGVKIAEGTPFEVKNNPQVIEAYLGTKDARS